MGVNRTEALLRVVSRLPLFAGVRPEEANGILDLCEFRRCAAGDVLCEVGHPAGEMAIVLSGQLGVYGPNDLQLAGIDPGSSVGEMGLVTGQPRSATVRVLRDCTLLVMRKTAFERLLRSDTQVCRRVYANVMRTLSERLQDSARKQAAAEDECDRVQAELDGTMEELGRASE